METHDNTTTQDKQVTIDVPADRLAEFYAFYGRFLAVGSDRRRHRHEHGGHPRGGRHGGGRRCGPHEAGARTEPAAATTPVSGPEAAGAEAGPVV